MFVCVLLNASSHLQWQIAICKTILSVVSSLLVNSLFACDATTTIVVVAVVVVDFDWRCRIIGQVTGLGCKQHTLTL